MRFLWQILLYLSMVPVWASEPTLQEQQNLVIEQRLADIASELRCLVCQNESIAASRADLAVDLRRQIHEQIAAGKTNQQILTYMVDRYGDFVRYRPPLKPTTVLLWFGPVFLLVASVLALLLHLRRRSERISSTPLSEHDMQHANALLQHHTDRDISS